MEILQEKILLFFGEKNDQRKFLFRIENKGFWQKIEMYSWIELQKIIVRVG